MTSEQKKERILAAIKARCWSTADCFWKEACELRDAGLIHAYPVDAHRC